MMKNKSKAGLLLLILAIVGWFAVVRPQIDTFSQRSFDASVKNKELASYQTRVDNLNQIKNDKNADVENTLQSLYLAMPKQSQIPEVLVMMENIGSNTGVVFNSLAVGNPTANEVPVTIIFTGRLGDVTNFLTALDKNVRTVSVKSQSISSDKNGNMSVTMQLGLAYQGS